MLKLVQQWLKNPSLLRPHVRKESILDINYEHLSKIGIRCILFDRDNTLSKHLANETTNEILELTQRLDKQFEVAIVSNAVIDLNTQFNIRILKTKLKKPFNFEEIKIKLGKVDNQQICVIGDRLLTDVALANMNGCVSILVNPIDTSNESLGIWIMRQVEWIYLKGFHCQAHPYYGNINC